MTMIDQHGSSSEVALFNLMSHQTGKTTKAEEITSIAEVPDRKFFCRRGHPKNEQNTRWETKRVRGKTYLVRECRVCCRLLFNEKYRTDVKFREKESIRNAARYVGKVGHG